MSEEVESEKAGPSWDKAMQITLRLLQIAGAIIVTAVSLLTVWVLVRLMTGQEITNEDLLFQLRYGDCITSVLIEERQDPAVVKSCIQEAADLEDRPTP